MFAAAAIQCAPSLNLFINKESHMAGSVLEPKKSAEYSAAKVRRKRKTALTAWQSSVSLAARLHLRSATSPTCASSPPCRTSWRDWANAARRGSVPGRPRLHSVGRRRTHHRQHDGTACRLAEATHPSAPMGAQLSDSNGDQRPRRLLRRLVLRPLRRSHRRRGLRRNPRSRTRQSECRFRAGSRPRHWRCNWLVCMGLWLCYGADTFSGKILGTWFR